MKDERISKYPFAPSVRNSSCKNQGEIMNWGWLGLVSGYSSGAVPPSLLYAANVS